MKKVVFGLLVAMTAIGVSTLTSAKNKTLRLATIWYQTSEGVYQPSQQPGTTCSETSDNSCRLVFPSDVPTGTYPSFTIEQLPDLEAEYGTADPEGGNLYYD